MPHQKCFGEAYLLLYEPSLNLCASDIKTDIMQAMSEESRYKEYFENKEKSWESLCKQCGGCCGAFDDPCKYLKKGEDGLFFCEIYPSRLGERITIKGERFDCVSIKKILHTHWRKDYLCTYKQSLKIKR